MSSTLDVLEEFLMKARRRLSDENPDYMDEDEQPEDDGLSNVDESDLDAPLPEEDEGAVRVPKKKESSTRELNFDDGSFFDDESGEPSEDESDDETSGDAADAWLSANDPKRKQAAKPTRQETKQKPATAENQAPIEKPAPAASPIPPAQPSQMPKPAPVPGATPGQRRLVMPSPPSADTRESDDMQPTRQELAQLRDYTRAWSSRARNKAYLEAEAHKNPGRHHEGRLIEARNLSHADYKKAYREFTQSLDFKNADPFTQMEMEDQFQQDWRAKNPDHLRNALKNITDAHAKGLQAKDLYAQAKDEKIRHIASGGFNPDAVSMEEGIQHAGGSREEDDAAPSGIQQDKSAAFASANKDFIDQYMKQYDEKMSKRPTVGSVDPYAHADEQRPDVASVIGEGPQFKDAAQKRAHDMMTQKYYPLIERAARRVLGKMGLREAADSNQIDERALHEAGIHALYEAINDYDHDHPSKASFVTHLNRKMTGLMQSALKAQDEIPAELRSGVSRFKSQQRMANASPIKHTNKQGVTTILNPSPPKPAATPSAPAPTPEAPPAPVVPKVAPIAPKKRTAAEIASAHHPDIQDRLNRVSALKPKRNINFVAPGSLDEEE